MFDHEKLDVYRLELEFITWVTHLLREVKGADSSTAEARDQLDRASLSALLNTAEGNGKRQRQVRYFDDARGSATECAACLDALVAKEACDRSRIQEGKEMLVRIAQMLTRLVQMYSAENAVREDRADYESSSNSNSSSSSVLKPEDEFEFEDDRKGARV